MKTGQSQKWSRTKVYAATITLLLFTALAGLVFYQHANSALHQSLDGKKVEMEQMLSEKLLLEKEISSMKAQLKAMTGQNAELDSKLKNTIALVSERERNINGMRGENERAKKVLSELNALRDLKKSLEFEIAQMKGDMDHLLAENGALKNQVVSLQTKNDELAHHLESMSQVAINNALVEATKGKKDRLTVKAKKAKKVKVGFELPEEMIGNIFFRVMTPGGQVVTSDHSTISVTEDDGDAELIASVEPDVIGRSAVKKHVDLVYEPKEKLEKGIYKIEIYSGDLYLGTTRVHLR